jgi:16S rRNA processing protein RimM
MSPGPVRRDKSTESGPDDFIYLGKFTKPHGLRGQVRFLPDFDPPDLFEGLKTKALIVKAPLTPLETVPDAIPPFAGTPPKTGWFTITVGDWFSHQKFLIFDLPQVDDIDQAELLRGYEVYVRTRDLWDLPEGQYFHYQLIDMQVIDSESGQLLGMVKSVQSGSAYDFLQVLASGKKPFLIPFKPPILQSVDKVSGVIKVSLPPGLDEL